MQPSPRDNYLLTEVTTATPQKLHLMLIEAAVRSAEQARQKWHAGQDPQASEALLRAQQIMGELLAGLNREIDPELVKKTASVYLFVFRSLMEANHQHSQKKLDDALRVLSAERETWRQVCQQLGSRKPSGDQAAALKLSRQSGAPHAAAAAQPPLAECSPGASTGDDSAFSGLSLEA